MATAAHPTNPTFLSPKLFKLLTDPNQPTVSSTLAQNPSLPIHAVGEKLYGAHHGHTHHNLSKDEKAEGEQAQKGGGLGGLMEKLHLSKSAGKEEHPAAESGHENKQEHVHNPAADQWEAMRPLSQGELEEVARCGNWGSAKPDELFLNVYAQALLAIESYPLNGMVSPPLFGAHGVVPLTVISVIPDIIQHYADVIVRAEHEIFLATNYWEASGAGKTITDAIKELSRRVMERKGEKIILKMMYDRGNPQQVLRPHQPVDAKTYTGDKIKLPSPEEIPGVIMEVQNYHEPPVGTFHAKYMVVDRKVALLNSNNIQDRVNVEMMCHIEGPIVQSFYDMALLSWSNALSPPLPLIAHPPTYPANPTKENYTFGKAHPVLGDKSDSQARQTLADHHREVAKQWDQDDDEEAKRVNGSLATEEAISQHLNTGTKISSTDTSPPPNAEKFKPIYLHSPHDPVPMALVNRPPRGKPGHGDTYVPQDQAWLAGFKFAKKSVFIQTPTFNAVPVVEAALSAVRRGVLVEIYADLGFNDEGELLPFQGGTNSMVASEMYSRLSDAEKPNLKIYWYTGKDQKTPLNAKDKSRNCHVKLMIVDEQIGIQGNGNQDTQSWFHSQEINMLLSSHLICSEWREAIDSNQNTKFYGLVDPKDGLWRDKEGKELPGVPKPPKGPMKSLVGVKGAIQRVRGEGGF